MSVIRHDQRDAKIVSLLMSLHAAFQHNLTRPLRQFASVLRGECYKVRFVVALKMGQVPTIETHSRIMGVDPEVQETKRRNYFLTSSTSGMLRQV